MNVSMIYARASNYCIGRDGGLPWSLPDDMAFFEQTTRNSVIIMGRRTYEDHESVIPGRINVVVTRRDALDFVAGIEVRRELAGALALALDTSRPAFVIGGAGLFSEAFALASCVFETIVDAQPDGDTFIEAFDFTGWETSVLVHHAADTRHSHAFTILCHRRPVSGMVHSPA